MGACKNNINLVIIHKSCHQLIVTTAACSEETVSTAVFLTIMKGTERLLLADVMSRSDTESIIKLSMDRFAALSSSCLSIGHPVTQSASLSSFIAYLLLACVKEAVVVGFQAVNVKTSTRKHCSCFSGSSTPARECKSHASHT